MARTGGSGPAEGGWERNAFRGSFFSEKEEIAES